MTVPSVMVLSPARRPYGDLGDDLQELLAEYHHRLVTRSTLAEIEARVTDRCLRHVHANGLDPEQARMFVLENRDNPWQLLVADEDGARKAVRSGRWVDRMKRFEDDVRMSQPAFVHDCDACTFLGQFRNHDLYFCTQHGLPTVIARFGDKGPEYTSGMALADVDPILGEARDRAKKKGLTG